MIFEQEIKDGDFSLAMSRVVHKLFVAEKALKALEEEHGSCGGVPEAVSMLLFDTREELEFILGAQDKKPCSRTATSARTEKP